MTPLEQVKRIENTINQFKRELESLRLDVRSCEDVIEGFQQALNDIQKVKPAVIDKGRRDKQGGDGYIDVLC